MLKSLYLISETMRYPPEEWGIRSEEMFGSHEASDTELPLIADVLVQVNRAAKLDGCYKIVLGGSGMLSVTLQAKDVLVMGGAAAFTLTLERWPRDVVIKINMTTSDWFDVEER